jgi:gliding motility-associated-like protein
MKRILLLITALVYFGALYSQNVNYTVEIVSYYAGPGIDDGFGFDEEPTWKCWGMDDGNVSAMVGGVCEGDNNNVPFTFTGHSNIVLLNETNTPATSLTIQLQAWEDDNISNAPGSIDRCDYGSGDDNQINTVFPAFNFRDEPHCQWNGYSFDSGDFRVSIKVKWEYTDFTVVTPITGCGSLAQLNAEGSGEWSIVSGTGGSFTSQFDTNAVMNGVVGNTYQLNWSYLSGCITTATPPLNVDVNMLADPIPNMSTASNLCENGDLIFTASNGISYDWATGTQGNTVSTTSNGLDTIFNVTSGDLPVYVTVTDANGCIATESWSSILTAGPPVDLGNDTTICSGTVATLDASQLSPYLYTWNNGETASIITPSSAGEYIVAVTDLASGCAGYDTVNVSVFPPSLLFLGYDIEFCIGDEVILDAQPGFTSYTWSDGSTNQTNTITDFGEVSVTIVDTNNCVLQDTINFSPVYTYYSLYIDTTIFLGNSVTLTGPDGVSHLWNNGLTTQDITISPIEYTTYIVTALQANGCYDVADVNVIINEELNFFIPNLFTPSSEQPDGNNDKFLIYGNGINEDNFKFTIFNRWGEIVFETTDVNEMLTSGWDGTFNEQQQPVGTYVWVMTGFQDDNDNTPLQFAGKNTGTILLKR